MAKRTIYVGREHEKAFNSIRFLIENKGLEGFGYEVVDGKICSDKIEYVLSLTEGTSAATTTFGFGPTGATWFAALRGEAGENDNATWMDFMNRAKVQYHKNYSVVQYKQQKKSASELEEARQEATEAISTFASLFYPDMQRERIEVREVTDSRVTEHIYGVAMRLELATEAGDPFPILCKVYFNRNGDRMWPLTSNLSKSIDENIGSIVPDDADGEVAEADGEDDTIQVTLTQMEELIRDRKKNFADYICFSDETDEKRLQSTRRQMAHDRFQLECKNVDLLYITHIRTESYVCDLYVSGVPMLRVIMGINNRLSIRCLNCEDKNMLVNRNEITYKVNGKTKNVVLDTKKPNFGLTDEVVEEIREYSRIADHFKTVSCGANSHKLGGCRQLKCKTQLMMVGDVEFCSDCPYPEVIYTDFDGQKHYTPSVVVATDSLRVYPKFVPTEGEDAQPAYGTCTVCRRTFSKGYLLGGKCKGLCAPAFGNNEKDPAAKKLYWTYNGMLPLTSRVAALFAPKRCYEDDELIIFVIGKKKYVFNKLNAGERGYLESPKSIG